MQVFDVIARAQGGRAIDNIAQATGAEPEQMEACVRSVVGDLSLSIERNTLSRGGLADLVKAIGDAHHEFILDNPRAMADPRVAEDGNEILAHILGSKDRSRAVAMRAAQASGLGEGLIKMLLPYIAQMLMGAIAKWGKGSGGLGDILGKLPGGGAGLPFPMPGGGAQSGGEREGRTGGGFELPRSEVPQGGYPLPPIGDEVPGAGREPGGQAPDEAGGDRPSFPWPRSGGDRRGGSPFPFPFPFPQGGGEETGEHGGVQIPWPRPQHRRLPEDDYGQQGGGGRGGFELPRVELPQGGYPLPPIEDGGSGREGAGRPHPLPRSGGQGLPLPLPGPGSNNPYGDLSDILRKGGGVEGTGPLGGLVRNILGGLLGFGGSGIVGWIVRLLIMRFGWNFLKRMAGRALTGR